jgi:hypothetical protein
LGGGDGWALGGGVAPELRSREDRGLGNMYGNYYVGGLKHKYNVLSREHSSKNIELCESKARARF